MLLLSVFIIMIVSFFIPFLRKKRSSIYLVGLTTSLFIFWIGILIYIAKKGGFDKNLLWVLFGTNWVRVKLQYLRLTLGTLGYIVALGRYLFPPFLLLTASEFSYFPLADKIKKHWPYVFLIPLFTLIIYIPAVFEVIAQNDIAVRMIVKFSLFWILAYIALTIYMIIKELVLISMPFFRRRFFSKMCLLFSLAFLYTLYSPQDPAQIYLFYRNEFMGSLGLWYLQKGFNLPFYVFVGVASTLFSIIGLVSMIKFTQLGWGEHHEEISLEKAAKGAQTGINMFSHGVKNELIANNILYNKLEHAILKEEPKEEILNYLDILKDKNQALLLRIEKLYRSSKHSHVVLSKASAKEVVDMALKKFFIKYPDGEVENLIENDFTIMCDKEHLSEALYNVISNGFEASQKPVRVNIKNERLWTNITVQDFGPGIPKKMQKTIYTPFVSSKNSALNWGMGLYYTRDVVKSHFGSLRFETSNKGTVFYIMLPRLREERNVQDKSIDY